MGGNVARAILVSTVTALTIGTGALAMPQQPPPKPRPVYGPNRALQASVVRNVRAMPASMLDSNLPAMPLDLWLFTTLAPHVEIARASLADWHVTMCEDPEAPVPGAGPILCVEVEIPVTLEKTVHLVVVAGEFVWTATPGLARWQQTAPSLREVYIDGLDGNTVVDSLDVPTLGALEASLRRPRDQWPTNDLQTEITWTPSNALPGDIARVTIEVANKGRRSVDRAFVSILIAPCCPGDEVRRDWFPRVAAGESVQLTVSLPLGEASTLVSAMARPAHSPKRVVDANERDQHAATALIGQPR
jgi:hypothetical protein